jgi:hypothetical protein
MAWDIETCGDMTYMSTLDLATLMTPIVAYISNTAIDGTVGSILNSPDDEAETCSGGDVGCLMREIFRGQKSTEIELASSLGLDTTALGRVLSAPIVSLLTGMCDYSPKDMGYDIWRISTSDLLAGTGTFTPVTTDGFNKPLIDGARHLKCIGDTVVMATGASLSASATLDSLETKIFDTTPVSPASGAGQTIVNHYDDNVPLAYGLGFGLGLGIPLAAVLGVVVNAKLKGPDGFIL